MGSRVSPLHLKDPFHLSTAPFVDTLVLIPHHAEVPALPGQELENVVLGAVGVLVLIDQNPAEAFPVSIQNIGMFFEKPSRHEEQIVEVDRARFPKAGLVGRVDLLHLGVHAEIQALELIRSEPLALGPADHRQEQAGGVDLPVDPEVGSGGGDRG